MKNIFLFCFLSILFANTYAADGDSNQENTSTQANADSIDTPNSEGTARHIPNTRLSIEKDLENLLSTSLTEVLKLNALDEEFDLYYLAADEEPLGSLLIFPDNRNHSDWPVTLNPLRTKLTEHQWQTAVLTLPDSTLASIPERTNYETIPESDAATTDTTPSNEQEQALTEENAESNEPTIDENTLSEPVNSLAQVSLARAQSAAAKLKENSDILIIVGIGQGATWATSYATTMLEADKENSQLILINPQQSTDISAGDLIEMISQLKINTLDIYTPQKNSIYTKDQAKARKRAANRSEAESYKQVSAPASSWQKSGNNWVYKKIRGLLKNNIEKQLEEKEMAMEDETAQAKEKMNQRPGSISN